MKDKTIKNAVMLKRNLNIFSNLLLILSVISVPFVTYSIVNRKGFSLGLLLLESFFIGILISSIFIKKQSLENISKVKNVLWVVEILSLLSLLFLAASSTFPGFFLLVPFYSLFLLRDIYRFEMGFYEERKFLDKFLKFIQVLLIITFVIIGIGRYIYHNEQMEIIREDIFKGYLDDLKTED